MAVALTLASCAMAQEAVRNYEPNTVQVNAQGKFETEPDTAVLTLTLSDKEPNQQTAYTNVSDAAEQLRAVLRQNGVDPKQARVATYNIMPEFDYRKPDRKPVAYTVQTMATLKLKDFALANKLLAAFSDVPHSGNQNLSYTLEDIDEAKQKAIADAYAHARASAQTVASASQRQLGQLSYASVDTQVQVHPIPMVRMGTAMKTEAAPAPTEDMGQELQTITAQVTAVFRLQ
jgi:uncharacterized protein YggE